MRLTYIRNHNLTKLHTELLSLSFLQPIMFPDGDCEAVFILCGDGQTVYLDVPDDLTPEQVAEIERVVNAHVLS